MESFEEFKDSFAYGSRNDLSFKFLKRLDPADAAQFFSRLLDEVGHTFDDSDLARIHEVVYDYQLAAYAPDPDVPAAFQYESGPFAGMRVPLSEARVGLLTSSGHFTEGDDPEPFGITSMTQAEAEDRIDDFLKATPVLSRLHRDVAIEDINVRHGGYDIRSAGRDHNVTLPRDALAEAERDGVIGEFAETMYSFVGATAQGRLRKHALPEWVEELESSGLDALLLVPV